MKSYLVLAWLLASVSAFAGNEAGGNWVVTRFRARAYLALSELCRYPETARGISDPDLRKLETLVENTLVQGVTETDAAERKMDWQGQPFRIIGQTIFLRKKMWERYFDANADVHAEALVPYYTLAGQAQPAETADVLNLSGLATGGLFVFDRGNPGRGIPSLRQGVLYWKHLPGRFTAAEARALCQRLNEQPATRELATWSLPSESQALPAAAALGHYVDSLPYKRPASYRVWTTDEKLVDLIDLRADAATENRNGALCVGAARD